MPFSLKKCSCYQLTDEKTEEIKTKIATVRSNIKKLEEGVEKCNDCPRLDGFKTKITRAKNYLQIIEDVLDSECCRAMKEMPK